MISFSIILLRLCVALLLGAAIGLERESNDHSAGIRTNTLVALGSALFTIISAYGFSALLQEPHIQIDPTRVASYIIAGIGFLGGGTIFLQRRNGQVKGLTTAAAVWVVAAIGMACGVGMLLEALVVSLLTLVVLIGLRYLERTVWPFRQPQRHTLSIEVAGTQGEVPGSVLAQAHDICRREGIIIDTIEIQSGKGIKKGQKAGETTEEDQPGKMIELECRAPDSRRLMSAVSDIRELPGVLSISAHFDDAG